jgi:tetratricopeptide (TPR) repeat protein
MKRFPTTVLLLFFLLSAFSPAGARSVLTIDADKQFRYAEKLYTNKDYDYAIAEYKRFLHFFAEDNRVEPAMYAIGRAYFAAGRIPEAIAAFNDLIDRFEDTALAVKSYFKICECHVAQKNYGPALTTLRNLIMTTPNINIQDEARYRMGWIHLETGSWDKARSAFSQISGENREKYRLKRLSDQLDKETEIPRKSPATAGVLSIVPGAGHLYCERYQDALIAFIVNGGLIAGAYAAFEDENYALGGLVSLVELGFYSGTIYSAVSSAHKYNKTQTHRFIDQLKRNTRINVSADPRARGITISLHYPF